MIKELSRPEGLSEKGNVAYDVIIAALQKAGLSDDTGGCKTFYSPDEWKARGEQYGTSAHLVIVYDGALQSVFNSMVAGDLAYDLACLRQDLGFDAREVQPTLNDKISTELAACGLFIEECTGWYAAVYDI